jgi:tetratricopeptide (TPR) repeat protein
MHASLHFLQKRLTDEPICGPREKPKTGATLLPITRWTVSNMTKPHSTVQRARNLKLTELQLLLKRFVTHFVTSPLQRLWRFTPPYVRWFLLVVAVVFYLGRGQATVILPFQLPPESKEQPLPFNGVTVANTLRDAITALRDEAAGQPVPSPCDFLATEDKTFEGLSAQSSASFLGPSALSVAPFEGFGAQSSTSFQIHGPVTVEVRDLSLERLASLARALLGHERVISGDLVLDGQDSFQLMARGNNDGPWTVGSEKISLSGLKKASCAMADQILRRTDRNVIAAALIRRRQYNEVISLYGTPARGDQQNADALNNLGVALFMAGRIDDAAAKLRQALALRWKFPEAHDNLGNVFGCQRRYSEAITEYRKATQLRPDLPEAQSNLGMALSLTGHWDQAVDAYEKAIDLRPDDPEKHVLLGTAFAITRKYDESAVELDKAIALKPDSAEVHRGVGVALQAGGKFEQAIAEYKKAIELKPEFLGAHIELAGVLLVTKRVDEAVSECRKAIDLKPDSPQAHVCLGGSLMAKAEDLMFSPLAPEVIGEFKKAIQLNPDLPEAHNSLGIAFMLTGRLDEAVSELKKVVELTPISPEAHNNLARVLKMKGRNDEAIVELEKALELKPDFPDAKRNLKEAFALKNRQNLSR